MKLFRNMLVTCVALVSLISAHGAAQSPAAGSVHDRYAAVAFSSATKRYGYSYNCASLARAQQVALSQCGTADARVVAWSKNGYVAVARGYRGATGWASASDAATARRLALANCLRYSSYSAIVVCVSAQQ